LKITDVDTVIVGARLRNWVFVKVVTDEPGLVGWGEATLEWKTQAVAGAVRDLTPLLQGRDPFRIEDLWQSMRRHQFWPLGIIGMSALSGIDQALHDVKAKALGVPIYELLGGRVRDRIRLYDHLGGGDPDAVYATTRPDHFAEAAATSVAEGFTAVKVLPVPPVGPLAGAAEIRSGERALAAIRNQVGDHIEIMVDLHGRTSPAAAIQVIEAMAPYRPWFVEEPVQPGDVGQLRQVAEAVGVPLATGERLAGRQEFHQVLEARAVAVIQPDVCHCGGLSELRRIAAMAEMYGVSVAPHNPLGPVATAHNLHFAASSPNWLIQEQMRAAAPWWDEVVTRPLEITEGHVALPEGPGLGLEVDEEAAARHPGEPEPQLAAARLDDGSVTDW
jgi:galactonate dehydratase